MPSKATKAWKKKKLTQYTAARAKLWLRGPCSLSVCTAVTEQQQQQNGRGEEKAAAREVAACAVTVLLQPTLHSWHSWHSPLASRTLKHNQPSLQTMSTSLARAWTFPARATTCWWVHTPPSVPPKRTASGPSAASLPQSLTNTRQMRSSTSPQTRFRSHAQVCMHQGNKATRELFACTNTHTHKHTSKQTSKQTNKQTNKHTSKQTNKHMHARTLTRLWPLAADHVMTGIKSVFDSTDQVEQPSLGPFCFSCCWLATRSCGLFRFTLSLSSAAASAAAGCC